ncbi:hypothetical protein GW17_00030000 [Ensete ventricosum]|nr:hypothetical protein GW17_00030000 [Ensete ventricosum]
MYYTDSRSVQCGKAPYRAVTGTWTARYRAASPKIDHRQLILVVGGRLREKKGRRRKGKEKTEEEEKKNLLSTCRPRPRAVATLAPAPWPPFPAAAFSPARGVGTSPRAVTGLADFA